MIRTIAATLILIPALAFSANPTKPSKPAKAPETAKPPADKWMQAAREGKDLFAVIHTNQGDIEVKLFPKEAPKAVENFVGLASGEKPWTHPMTRKQEHKPLYDGVTFHRVIPGFMIQGGDPLGEGYGGPGYTFADELQTERTFDKPGILAMANSGPNTNGSQFFITVAPAPHLNHHYTIFGEVVKGQDVVQKIDTVPRDPHDKPLKPVVIKHIEIRSKQ